MDVRNAFGVRTPAQLGNLTFVAALVLNVLFHGRGLADLETLTLFFDAKGYAEAGSALLGGGEPRVGLVSLRGYLYPMAAMGLAQISPIILVLIQLLAVSFGVRFLAETEILLSEKLRMTPLALLSISLLLAPGTMMTEAFAFFLGAAAIRAFSAPHWTWMGVLLLGLAALVKPAFLPIFAISLLTLPLRRQSLIAATIVGALFATQLLLTANIDGAARLSSAGDSNFSNRFYPAVYGQAEGLGFVSYRSEAADIARSLRPEISEQVHYVLSHPGATLKAWISILWEKHLTAVSGFATGLKKSTQPQFAKVLADISGALSFVFVVAGLLGLAGSIFFVRGNFWRSWPAAAIAPSLLATAPLVYWQGDRIVFIPLIFLLPFSGLALDALANRRRRSSVSNLGSE